LLKTGEYSAKDISKILGIMEKEVYEHLAHVEKSSLSKKSIISDPARCLDCGFVFKKRTRFSAPSRCPVCRSESITTPLYSLVKAGPEKS
jgi:transcriptional regulator